MSRTLSTTQVQKNLYGRYSSGEFAGIYNDVCGENSTYSDASVGNSFNSYVANDLDPDSRLFRDAITQTGPEAERTAAAIFKNFLDNGSRCHETSPAGRAFTIHSGIANARDNVSKYEAWRKFISLFDDYTKRLVELISQKEAPARKETRNEINSVIEDFEPFAKRVDKVIEHLLGRLDPFLKGVVSIQIAATRDIRSMALAITSFSDPLRKQIDTLLIAQLYEALLDTLDSYYDPFIWAKKAYTDLSEIKRLYLSDEQIYTTVTVSEEHPLLDRGDGVKVKMLIDAVVFASMMLSSREEPVALDLSWDDEEEAMVIMTSNLIELRRHSLWEEIERTFLEMGGSSEVADRTTGRGQLVVPIRTVAGNIKNGGNGGTSPPPASGDPDDTTVFPVTVSGLLDSGEASPAVSSGAQRQFPVFRVGAGLLYGNPVGFRYIPFAKAALSAPLFMR